MTKRRVIVKSLVKEQVKTLLYHYFYDNSIFTITWIMGKECN